MPPHGSPKPNTEMAVKPRILFISQKITPYLPADEISTLGKELPHKMVAHGYEVRTVVPKFGSINERRNQLHEVIRLSGLNIPINDNDHPLIIKVASLQPARIQVYFIDNDDYFLKEDSDADIEGSNRDNNDERIIFFARGTTETVRKLRWEPDVIQAAGWPAALLPLYMRRAYIDDPAFAKAKIVYMVLPGEITGTLDPAIFRKLGEDGIPTEEIDKYVCGNPDTDTLHRMAIDFSEGVIFYTSEPDPGLLEYARSKGLPILTRDQLDEKGDAYADFYNSLRKSEN